MVNPNNIDFYLVLKVMEKNIYFIEKVKENLLKEEVFLEVESKNVLFTEEGHFI